jgi:hypothetical protein
MPGVFANVIEAVLQPDGRVIDIGSATFESVEKWRDHAQGEFARRAKRPLAATMKVE